ncbi:hypothetical protein [Roseimicrobium sp. ORNL1]|uniref:hypothetical protein n=1 Tax=Roseimicrobium sp. ORNL1 TaxID=2711231 RepID=UPI0013E1C59C|nr:hypothetical protein [Roseimicrobium sp. ORNL1]QIF02777.1 hypothetical protein G5S37_15025 [Roseimicrobium sp. ORNL1]
MLKILGIADLYEWLRGGVGILQVLSEIARWFMRKVAPFAAVVTFFATPVATVLLNDDLWTTVQSGLGSMTVYLSTASASMGPWLSRINYMFPLSEGFALVALVAAVAVLAVVIRLTKAAIEFVLEVIPF